MAVTAFAQSRGTLDTADAAPVVNAQAAAVEKMHRRLRRERDERRALERRTAGLERRLLLLEARGVGGHTGGGDPRLSALLSALGVPGEPAAEAPAVMAEPLALDLPEPEAEPEAEPEPEQERLQLPRLKE